MQDLLILCKDDGFYQKTLFGIFALLNLLQALIMFSIFYIFYVPNYLCEDPATSQSYQCSQQKACSAGQRFRLDPSEPHQKSAA